MKSKIIQYIQGLPPNQDWREAIKSLNISVKEDHNLAIFNYGIEADFSNPVVQEARGIIINTKTWEVVCWPYSKFFNSHEQYADTIDWNNCRCEDKIDGCLDENTLLMTNYGPQTIKNILTGKKKYKVLTYNHELDCNEYQEIDDYSIRDNDCKQWYEIETDMGLLRVTGNHEVFCVNENQYKRVDELTGNEELQILEPEDYPLNGRLNIYSNIFLALTEHINLQYLRGTSIFELSQKYQISWKGIDKILKGFYYIVHRSIKESTNTESSKQKRKNTCMDKYGVENPSQDSEVKSKKENTFLEHYGVDNIRKLPKFCEYINEVCLQKYGKKRITDPAKNRETRRENLNKDPHYYDVGRKRLSEHAKQAWEKLTDEQKTQKIKALHDGL